MMWRWSELKRLLKGADDITSTACIMFPVGEEIPGVEDPHVTVIYLGDVASLNKEDILASMREVYGAYDAMFFARVKGVEFFGPEANIPVLLVEHSFLDKYRTEVEARLATRGIVNASEYKNYKPHITVTDEIARNLTYQTSYLLTQPELWWGREHIKP